MVDSAIIPTRKNNRRAFMILFLLIDSDEIDSCQYAINSVVCSFFVGIGHTAKER